jgi:hypothetical protein
MSSSVATPRPEPSKDAAQPFHRRNGFVARVGRAIDQRQRDQFLHEVAAELEANGQAGAVGIGSVHRVARTVQRRFFDPPQLPNASPRFRSA